MEAEDLMEPINVSGIDEGKLEKAINDELSKVGKDIVRRKDKPGSRKVMVEIKLSPEWSNDLDCYIVEVGWAVKNKVPSEEGVTSIATIENDIVMVNPLDASDPRQTTIEDHESDHEPSTEDSEDSEDSSEGDGPWDTPMRKVPAPPASEEPEPANASATSA